MAAFELPSPPAPSDRETDVPSAPDAPTPSAPPPEWRSDDLLAGAPEARITHGNAVYRLRVTMLGKLILTK